MIKSKTTYNHFQLLGGFKKLITYLFLLSLLVKPTANFLFTIVEAAYEISENINSEEQKENLKSLIDIEFDKAKNTINSTKNLDSKSSQNYFEGQESFTNSKLEIHLPPPKV